MILQDANQVSRLPPQQLAYLLEHVPIKERLSSCALVHSSWNAAAAEATAKISLMPRHINTARLSAWLDSHCSKVKVSKFCIARLAGPTYACSKIAPLQLPVTKLQHLRQLSLLSIAWIPATVSAGQQLLRKRKRQQGALPSLASLTALTRLDLTGASVRLDGLEALTGLKHLSISEVCAGPHMKALTAPGMGIPKVDTAASVLAAALPQLQRLTHLDLPSSICSTAVLAQVSTLQHVQQLNLDS